MSQADLSDMKIEQNNDVIQIDFPNIETNQKEPTGLGLTSGLMRFADDYIDRLTAKMPKGPDPYFRHLSEPGVKPVQPGEVKSYSAFHPNELALSSFRNHWGLAITPEVIGANILLDLTEYITRNQEKCAPIFNGKVGEKKDIKVWLNPGESLKDLSVLEKATKTWESHIRAESDNKIRDVLHPNFSRHNPVVDIVYSSLLMGAAKDFFDYSFATLCGIPSIAVEGSKNDWEQLQAMVNGLGSVKELSEIQPVYEWAHGLLGQIINVYNGMADPHFWGSLVKYESMSGSEGASAGWLPGFNLYQDEGRLLSMKYRWTPGHDPHQIAHLNIPTVDIRLISDNESGIRNEDPDLDMRVGFVSSVYRDNHIRPIVGVEAYEA